MIIFDSDWNPQNDLQAMARAHRIGQKSHVSVYRFATKGTVEEDVLERAKRKMVLEHAIINQLDTSGLHIGGGGANGEAGAAAIKAKAAATAKKDGHSREELAAILKFGAAELFKTDVDQAKLESMDLDEVINRAEAYETATTATGTSLGGEAFLQQFAQIQDVKNDELSWDEIIPAADRERWAKEAAEERKNRPEGAAANGDGAAASGSGTGRRRAAQGRGAYEGLDGAPEGGGGRKGKGATTAAQRSVDLKDRDLRVLVKAIQKFGDIRKRYEQIAADAKLQGKNRAVLIKAYDELVAGCRQACVDQREVQRATKAPGERADKKAVMTSFRGVVNVNAETTVARVDELRVLHAALHKLPDPTTWRIPVDKLKPTSNWTASWADKDDAMLLVGCWMHGVGSWEAIRDDAALGLTDKFFLEDGKRSTKETGETAATEKKGKKAAGGARTPSAVHLVRRTDYLLHTLAEDEPEPDIKPSSSKAGGGRKGATAKREREAASAEEGSDADSDRPIAKGRKKAAPTKPASKPKAKAKPKAAPASKGKAGARKAAKSAETVDEDDAKPAVPASTPATTSAGSPPIASTSKSAVAGPSKKREAVDEAAEVVSENESAYDSMDDEACKDLLKPVKKQLKTLKQSTDNLGRDEKIAMVRNNLGAIGERINVLIDQSPAAKREQLTRHLWKFVTYFCACAGSV